MSYSGTIRGHFAPLASGLSMYTSKAWMVTILTTALALIVIGLPTAIYENPFFVRMTPVRPQDYVRWVLSSVLIGLIVGSYFAAGSTTGEGKVLSGGVLSLVSVGCPTCNQLVVLFLGTGGALTFLAPLQVYIGVASVLLLGWTFVLRTKALAGTCAVNDGAR